MTDTLLDFVAYVAAAWQMAPGFWSAVTATVVALGAYTWWTERRA